MMKHSLLLLFVMGFASSCQHRAPASIETTSVPAESCSMKAETNKKLRTAKKQFMDLMYLIRKQDRTQKETFIIQNQIRKWESRAFTKDASAAFSQKIIKDLNKLNPPFMVYIREGELIDKFFDNRDHSVELKRYHIQIRENSEKLYNLRLLCQSTYNCLNDQDFKSTCSIEEP